MNVRPLHSLVSIAALAACTAVFAQNQPAIEISDDGREIVRLRRAPSSTDSGGIAGPSAVPFPLTPDWQNTQRRQVGGLQAVDMNGDELIDLVVAVYNSNSFPAYTDWHNLIYYNTGTELEANPSWISTDQVSTGDIQVGFINNDAYPDVFAANGGFAMSPSVIYFGTATGPSTSPGWTSVISGNAWNNYAILFDVDHDGDTDVVTANQGNSPNNPFRPIFMFRNNAGTLETTPSWQTPEMSIQNFLAFGDMDGDGWEDLAVSKWTNGFQSGVYKNLSGTLATTTMWTTGNSATDKGVAWADVDDNGWLDLALGADAATTLYSNTNGVMTSTWTSTAPFFGHSDLRFHDVDGDGDQDLAEIHFSDGKCHIYLNNNGVLSSAPSWTYDAPQVGNAVVFGDINGDGWDDLITGYAGEPSIRVFYAIPPTTCAGDLNGDQAIDMNDLLALIGAWGSAGGPADLNDDNVVDVNDLLILVGAWGPCA